MAVRFAVAGYIVPVTDLYRGKSTMEQEGAHHAIDALNFLDAINNDVRGVVQYLRHSVGRRDPILHGHALTWPAISQTAQSVGRDHLVLADGP